MSQKSNWPLEAAVSLDNTAAAIGSQWSALHSVVERAYLPQTMICVLLTYVSRVHGLNLCGLCSLIISWQGCTWMFIAFHVF